MRTVPIVILSLLMISTVSISASAQDISPIILTQIELVTVSESEFSVTWVTNLPSNSRVQYGTSELLNDSHTFEGDTLFHSIFIDGLEPDTTYFYRIGSNSRWSDIETFKTLSPEGPPDLTIVIIGDAHLDVDAQNTASGSMNGDSDIIFSSTIGQLNGDDETDLVIFLGDMVNGAFEDYRSFFDLVSYLEKPSEFTFGNWEKNEENWEEIADDYLDTTSTYFSFDREGYHFIILDSAVQGEIGGSINSTQLQWLKDDLYRNRFEPTLVFMHHPLEDDGIFTVDEFTKKELNDIFNRNGQIISIFAGHNHKNTIENINGRSHCSISSLVQYPIGYSKLRLYNEGFSQHFLKVGSRLQTSEESKLLIDASSGSSTGHEEYLGDLDERSMFHGIIDDRPPVIDSVELTPEICHGGDRVEISIDAYDPDHEDISYSILVDGKYSEGSEPSMTFKAPVEPGVYTINITVTAGVGSNYVMRLLTVVDDGVHIDQPPVITELKADKYRVATGENVKITVTAEDPDGDSLSYKWNIDVEVSSTTGNSIEWIAPETPGTYTITVTVKANGKSVEDSISIIVEDRETTQSNETKDSPIGFFTVMIGVVLSLFIMRKRVSRR